MAKKQTRRSISVSRTTYERLKAFCEANNISMSQLVETRVNDFLGDSSPASSTGVTVGSSITPPALGAAMGSSMRPSMGSPMTSQRPVAAPAPRPAAVAVASKPEPHVTRPVSPAVPMTSAAARFAVDPPPPIIKPKQETAAPKPAEKRPEQIFTF